MKRLVHGGALDAAIAEHGGAREDWLDLSTAINPHAYPVPEFPPECWSRLPDSGAEQRLIAAAAAYYNARPDMALIPAPGTQALIELLPRILPGETATVLQTETGTYAEHAHCCAKAGRRVDRVSSPREVRGDEQLAVLVHPNNPDGVYWDPPAIFALADRLSGNDGFIIIDEAFCDCLPEGSFVRGMPGNMIVLRSFGKFFGLAGLRLGFAITSQTIRAEIGEALGPWAVSGPALFAGEAALRDTDWIASTRNRLAERSQALAELLDAAGMEVAGQHPLFVLARFEQAGWLAQELARRRILVRAFAAHSDLLRFGLPGGTEAYSRLGAVLDDLLPTPS